MVNCHIGLFKSVKGIILDLTKIKIQLHISSNLSEQNPLFRSIKIIGCPYADIVHYLQSFHVPMTVKGICVHCPISCRYIDREAGIQCVVSSFHTLQSTGSIVIILTTISLVSVLFVLQMKVAGCKVSQELEWSRRHRTDAQDDTGLQTPRHSPRPKKEIKYYFKPPKFTQSLKTGIHEVA